MHQVIFEPVRSKNARLGSRTLVDWAVIQFAAVEDIRALQNSARFLINPAFLP
jgi:hypothetical protein